VSDEAIGARITRTSEEDATVADAATAIRNKPAWVDLATKDPAAAREFYAKVLGWQIEVNPDPQYGGYGLARIGGQDAAGIGGTQSPDQPTAWSFYIGTDDLAATTERVKAAGGSVMAEPFDVGDQGRMAVFQDPTGAFISAWEPAQMGASRPRARMPSAGRSSMPVASRRPCRSTARSSAGTRRRPRPSPSRTRSSRWPARAWPAPSR
jgi:predicted enzyme related to lactoylglutathione lyase